MAPTGQRAGLDRLDSPGAGQREHLPKTWRGVLATTARTRAPLSTDALPVEAFPCDAPRHTSTGLARSRIQEPVPTRSLVDKNSHMQSPPRDIRAFANIRSTFRS